MPTINQLVRNPRSVPRAKSKVKDLDGAPQWAITLVHQFGKWEALVRNDVPELRTAPSSFFDAILLNLAAVRALMTVGIQEGHMRLHERSVRAARAAREALTAGGVG